MELFKRPWGPSKLNSSAEVSFFPTSNLQSKGTLVRFRSVIYRPPQIEFVPGNGKLNANYAWETRATWKALTGKKCVPGCYQAHLWLNWLLVNKKTSFTCTNDKQHFNMQIWDKFHDQNSGIFVNMCLIPTVLTVCAWEPGSRFLHFFEVWIYVYICLRYFVGNYWYRMAPGILQFYIGVDFSSAVHLYWMGYF